MNKAKGISQWQRNNRNSINNNIWEVIEETKEGRINNYNTEDKLINSTEENKIQPPNEKDNKILPKEKLQVKNEDAKHFKELKGELGKHESIVQLVEIIQAVFILITVVLTYIATQMYESILENNVEGNVYNGGVKVGDFKSIKLNYTVLRTISLMVSILLVIIEVFSFNQKRRIEKDIQDLEEYKKDYYVPRNIVFDSNWWSFGIKILMFSINSIPGFHFPISGRMLGGRYFYTLDGFIMIIVLFRMLFWVNLHLFFSKWGSEEFRE